MLALPSGFEPEISVLETDVIASFTTEAYLDSLGMIQERCNVIQANYSSRRPTFIAVTHWPNDFHILLPHNTMNLVPAVGSAPTSVRLQTSALTTTARDACFWCDLKESNLLLKFFNLSSAPATPRSQVI